MCLSSAKQIPSSGNNTVYLVSDGWNDYSFVTSFHMFVHDDRGELHQIGDVRIGFKGQSTDTPTYAKISENFSSLSEEFFSLGVDVNFYKKMEFLPENIRKTILSAMRDIAFSPKIIEEIIDEKVFSVSLLRFTSLSSIKGKFARVLEGKPELTDYDFRFVRPNSDDFGEIELDFHVAVESTPSTNIHALIGRNGIGKTTLLNGMINAITDKQSASTFMDESIWLKKISNDYFSSLVSVSFSAFDPFTPPKEQPDPAKGTCYFYIGLKHPDNNGRHRTIPELRKDCIKALINCFFSEEKTRRWLDAIEKLGADENFSAMGLVRLKIIYEKLNNCLKKEEQPDTYEFEESYGEQVDLILANMSSGHAIVLLTITRLVATVEEKTLVLLDEPESHLHPPLLSAFIRTLSDLLYEQNGVAIIATHSPVVLQEIPKSCVWKIYRTGASITSSRPSIETFGENTGILTSEVFNLEVKHSGFHELLSRSVKSGKTYETIIADYKNQLGFEGKAILKTLIANQDKGINHDANE